MRKFYQWALLTVIAVSTVFSVSAQRKYFTDLNERTISAAPAARVIVPDKFRTIGLDNSALRSFLWTLPLEEKVKFNHKSAPVLELPMPDGRVARFNVWQSSIQEKGLEDKFPEIKTFAGRGIDDPYATIRFDYTPSGFHAQVLTINGSYYIDPYARGLVSEYISYFRTDLRSSGSFTCEVPDNPSRLGAGNSFTQAACLGNTLRSYRLAVACTGEYAQAPGVAAGANAATLHAAIVTTVNRVVGVYEKEISVRLILVANNNLVEFLNAGTDPFAGNNNANTLINESQTVIDANIGPANYDIGHTFSTGGGGLAQLNSPCGPSKARGITGSPSPTGDAYDIDYVAHEMGHQFGGNHSMAGCGSSPNNTKYEVGSGTTIQAYAGICAAENIQPNSDPFFHAISFDEISNFIVSGNGATCTTTSPTGNNLPVINPLPNNDLTIPIGTPFTLTGSATDVDGDALSYNWEQFDFSGTATWNAGATAPANNTVPLFKSRLPKTTGSRTFPDMTVIVANYPANPPATMGGLKGETLSPVPREMKFKLTVRDNRAGGGGVASLGTNGCQASVLYHVTVAGATPFTVTIPNGGESYPGNSTQTITWNTAATNAAPFNVANVKISLSTDGGLTYPTVLTASTANDGTEDLLIPNLPTTTARVKIEAIGNIFFDISNNNFTITAAVAGFTFTTPSAVNVGCAGPASASSTLATTSTGGYVVPIVLTATSGVPAGTTVSFGTNPVIPGNSSVVTLNNTNTLNAGTYNITVTGVSGAFTQTVVVSFVVTAGTAPTLTGPSAVTVCAGGNASFTVSATGTPTGYQWQVSTNGGGLYTNIAGATSATYTATAVTAAMNNNLYRVIVSTQCATATSAGALLTVQTAPAITGQPQNVVTCAGTSATFTVTATGAGLSYQWELSTDGGTVYAPIAGATAASYTVSGITLAMNNNRYRVVISGTCPSSVTSAAAILTVGSAASITGQPASVTVCEGANATFTATATGSSLTYQWQVSTDGGANFTNIAGATATSYTVSPTTVGQNGYQYRVVVFSCTPTGINSNAATLTVNTLATIGTQPASSTLCAGGNTSFTVAAAGTGLSYQWQSAATCAGTFTNIAGATTNTLTFNNVAVASAGAYRVVVTGTCNTVTSSCVTLTVNSPVVITQQPVASAVCLPNNASFSVTATGTAVTYQWQVSTNGGGTFTNITGATTNTLSLTGLTAAMNGNQYRVVLNGTCTTNLNSSAVTLTVNTPVAINTQPVNTSACAGTTAVFTVAATGSTITYQWQVSINNGPFVDLANAAPFSGVTTNTLTVSNVATLYNGYRFRVIVSGVPCGAVISNTATLTANALPVVVLTAASASSITPYTPTGVYATVSPNGNYVYSWTRNGVILPNVFSASLPVTVDALGEYGVTAIDVTTGCSGVSNKVTVNELISDNLFIYPNPTAGIFQVRYYNGTNSNQARSVNIYDSKGARVATNMYTVAINYGRMDVNMKNMSTGVYMVEVKDASGNRIASGRVIKQ